MSVDMLLASSGQKPGYGVTLWSVRYAVRANASSFLPSLPSSPAFYRAGMPDLAQLQALLLWEEGTRLEGAVLQTVKWLLTRQRPPQCNSHASHQPVQT